MIPGIGFQEFLLIAAIALIFIGPKDLPVMMRRLGQWLAKGQAIARELREAFDDIARQTELEEMKKEIEALKRDNIMRAAADDFARAEAEINHSVMNAPQNSEAVPSDADSEEMQPVKPSKN